MSFHSQWRQGSKAEERKDFRHKGGDQGGFGMIPDRRAAEHQLIRVIDESEEDYLYPESYFVPIELPEAAGSHIFANSSGLRLERECDRPRGSACAIAQGAPPAVGCPKGCRAIAQFPS